MTLKSKEAVIAVDNEGFLLDPAEWTQDIAEQVADLENIEMHEPHWLIVRFIRKYYEDRQTVPEARHALKALLAYYGKEKATRKFLYSLFPYGYGQQACKIAGMRKPLKLMLDV